MKTQTVRNPVPFISHPSITSNRCASRSLAATAIQCCAMWMMGFFLLLTALPARAVSDGTVVAWGRDSDGQATVPAGLTGVTAIEGGGAHTVALKSDGTLVAWGGNSFGQATVPSGLMGGTAVAAGGNYTVALKSDGTVVAWGANNVGQTTVRPG
jgi:alpha-tubulin suppressor-like RCC1 family protein